MLSYTTDEYAEAGSCDGGAMALQDGEEPANVINARAGVL